MNMITMRILRIENGNNSFGALQHLDVSLFDNEYNNEDEEDEEDVRVVKKDWFEDRRSSLMRPR